MKLFGSDTHSGIIWKILVNIFFLNLKKLLQNLHSNEVDRHFLLSSVVFFIFSKIRKML